MLRALGCDDATDSPCGKGKEIKIDLGQINKAKQEL